MKRGFTLIEILVSVALFSVVMVIAMGSLLSMSAADRKSETLKSDIDNLNFAIDSISRALRTGTSYGCSPGGASTPTAGTNCTNPGGNEIVFTSELGQTVYYKLDTSSTDCNQPTGTVGCIARSINGGAWSAITAPEIVVTNFASNNAYLFYVVGAPQGSADSVQPKVVITLSGSVMVSATETTAINLQTSVEQRIYDQ